jgi:hypothetical protein
MSYATIDKYDRVPVLTADSAPDGVLDQPDGDHGEAPRAAV